MKKNIGLLAMSVVFTAVTTNPLQAEAGPLSNRIKSSKPSTSTPVVSASVGGLVKSGNGLGSACGYLQPLLIYNQPANYQQALASQQQYLNSMIANESTQNAWGVTQVNDLYLQARAKTNLQLIQYKLDLIGTGQLVYNGTNGAAAIAYPGGSFALETDIFDSYTTATGAGTREFSLPSNNTGTLFRALKSSIAKIIENKDPSYLYKSFVYSYDYANRLERAVAAVRSYSTTGQIEFDQVPMARRFMCEGAYPKTITAPSAAEYTAMSPYVRAVFKAALTVTGDLPAVINSLSSAQKSAIDSADAEAGL